MVESWDSDVPDGKVTDFRKAVDAKPDEKVVFSWFEYPDKATRDAANEKMMSDPRMKEVGENMPFDGKRMIVGGFDAIVEEGTPAAAISTASSCRCRRTSANAYREIAAKMANVFREHGATRVHRGVGRRRAQGRSHRLLPRGEGRGRREGRLLLHRVARQGDPRPGWQKIMADESMKPEGDMPFNGQRMFWGGFEPIVDTAKTKEPAHA